MRKWVVAAVACAAITTGCGYGSGAFVCTSDVQCGAAGACEATHLCSRPNGECPSGRSYGDLAGDQSGHCVSGGSDPPVDASESPPVDASDSPPVDASID